MLRHCCGTLVEREALNITGFEGAMDQINVLSGSYGWLAAAFGILLLTGVVRYIASRSLAKVQQRADQTVNVWDDALVAAIRLSLIHI